MRPEEVAAWRNWFSVPGQQNTPRTQLFDIVRDGFHAGFEAGVAATATFSRAGQLEQVSAELVDTKRLLAEQVQRGDHLQRQLTRANEWSRDYTVLRAEFDGWYLLFGHGITGFEAGAKQTVVNFTPAGQLEQVRAELDRVRIELAKAHRDETQARLGYRDAMRERDKARAELAKAQAEREQAQKELLKVRAERVNLMWDAVADPPSWPGVYATMGADVVLPWDGVSEPRETVPVDPDARYKDKDGWYNLYSPSSRNAGRVPLQGRDVIVRQQLLGVTTVENAKRAYVEVMCRRYDSDQYGWMFRDANGHRIWPDSIVGWKFADEAPGAP